MDVSGRGHGPALTWSQATRSHTGFPSCRWAMGSGPQRLDLDPKAKACSAPARGALGERCWWRVCVGPPSFCPMMRGRLRQCPLLLLTSATSRPFLIHRPSWLQNPTVFSISRNHLAFSLISYRASRGLERAGCRQMSRASSQGAQPGPSSWAKTYRLGPSASTL